MPDYFKGSPGDPNWYPTDTEDKARLLQKFKTEKAFTPKNLPMVIQSAADAKLRWPSVQGWGVFGLCWGGKVRQKLRIILNSIANQLNFVSWRRKRLVPGAHSKPPAKPIPRKLPRLV